MTTIKPLWPSKASSPLTPHTLALRRILIMRAVAMAVGSGFVLVANHVYGQSLPNVLFAIFGAGVLAVALSIWRFRREWSVTRWELFGQLLFDVGLLTTVFIYTGGSSNPFISYFLVLLAIAAATLPRALSLAIALAAITVYSGLMAYDLTARGAMLHDADAFHWHLLGMWAIFVVSAMLITYSVSTLAMQVQRREAGLALAREQVMRNEQVVAVGALAAGVAHGLGTPLNTMAVLLNEMEEAPGDQRWRDDVHLLQAQVQRCRDELRRLSDVADQQKQWRHSRQPVARVVEALSEQVALTHPGVKLVYDLHLSMQGPEVSGDPTLMQALANLVENAVQAARSEVCLSVSELAGSVEFCIVDDGGGFAPQALEQLGEPFLSARQGGMGLGFFLANATIERLGGSIEVYRQKDSGTRTIVRLPLQ